jgi:hypothetical protein
MMARKEKRAQAAGWQRVEDLPQRFDVWEMDARQLPATVRVGEQEVKPWMTVVVSRTDGDVLTFELTHEAPAPDALWDTLLKAMQAPEAGEPHRPTQVLVRQEPWRDALGPRLQPLGIECATDAELGEADAVLEGLSAHLPGGAQPGLLDMPGITPEALASFFDAAALYYERAPWRRVGERPVEVQCPKFESGPWYAILMGQGGMARGLILYDSLETLQRIQRGDLSEEENARLSAALAVVFGDAEDLSAADREEVQRHGWRVAGPDAYPSVYRMDPGLAMRPPLAWELTLLEGCLRGLPEFVRKKTRRLEPLSLAVPTGAGELPLTLSWTVE